MDWVTIKFKKISFVELFSLLLQYLLLIIIIIITFPCSLSSVIHNIILNFRAEFW